MHGHGLAARDIDIGVIPIDHIHTSRVPRRGASSDSHEVTNRPPWRGPLGMKN
ncbi:MAG TPA: hypothetical protein VKM55_17460 [Candidatus Lokiarchaeia archaeon]|nr:hypothetical protein [Candidatus Lokiarchaeia archaeon]